MAPPENGVHSKDQGQFPPSWFPGLLRMLFKACHHSLVIALGFLAYTVGVVVRDASYSGQLQSAWRGFVHFKQEVPVVYLLAASGVATTALLLLLWRTLSKRPVYLLDFECYRPSPELHVPHDRFIETSRATGWFDDEAINFQERILSKSGVSWETFFPPAFFHDPPAVNMDTAREEAEMVLYGAVEQLLKKTGLKPRQIDVLVTNCSLFNPTPSLSAMVINHFKMRTDIDSYHLGGMGCSAGVIAVGLAEKLLRERGRGGYALVVSTENITQNWYRGNARSMLIPNTIFRMGSAAILLTNKRSERRRAKYSLEHVVRVHLGSDDDAFKCVYQKPDDDGNIGVELSKDLVKVAAKALTANMTRLGPKVLPWSEKLTFAANWVARMALGSRIAPYIPDFKQAFDHFCLHAGGRGVVEGLSKQLGLPHDKMAPSANTLYWYGNTSSSTVWYSFGFVESIQGVQKGDVVWQVGFGSGFKVNSAVWKALRPVKETHWAWERIAGRENEAMDTILALGKQKEKEAPEPMAGKEGVPCSNQAVCTPPRHEQAGGNKENELSADAVVRVLRNGKVVVGAGCH